ncbi:MAG: hypothetical protein LBH87_00995 [Coriobacteriales bacterium]|jgi:hypothetical protein|nr:hypothetical protein [Coriobacteriales bacterium]
MDNLSKNLDSFLSQSNNVHRAKLANLRQAWESIVSQEILDHTDNLIFDKHNPRIAVVYTNGSHIAAELTANKEIHKTLLSQALGLKDHDQLEDLRFAVTRRASVRNVFKKRSKSFKQNEQKKLLDIIPLTFEEESHAWGSVDSIKDKCLKISLFNAMKANLEWKKAIDSANKPKKRSERDKWI